MLSTNASLVLGFWDAVDDWIAPVAWAVPNYEHFVAVRETVLAKGRSRRVCETPGLFSARWPHPIPIIDVGANIGEISYCMIGARSAAHYVYSFEPIPVNLVHLCLTWFMMPGWRARWEIINAAVDRVSGNMTVYAPIGREDNTANTAKGATANLLARPTASFTVPTWALDDFCDERSIIRVGLVKIDVQGYEVNVLRGAQDLLAKHRIAAIYAEYDVRLMAAAGFGPRVVHDLMRRYGYEPYAPEVLLRLVPDADGFPVIPRDATTGRPTIAPSSAPHIRFHDFLWLPTGPMGL